MNSCREMTQLMSQQLDRRLSRYERVKLRLHLMMCKGCRNFERNLSDMRQIFTGIGTQDKNSGEAPGTSSSHKSGLTND